MTALSENSGKVSFISIISANYTISGSLSGINSIKCILYTLWNVYVTHCLPSVVKRKAVITEREDFSKYGSSLFSWLMYNTSYINLENLYNLLKGKIL